MRYLLIFLLAVFVNSSAHANEKINRTSYFKDKQKNRISTLSFKKGTSEEAIKRHAQNLYSTERRMTAGYYYIEGGNIPGHEVTQAGSLTRANRIIYEVPGYSKWQYAYMRSFNGKESFVNCQKKPNDTLCRQ